jgi:2'-5' RNA ligase
MAAPPSCFAALPLPPTPAVEALHASLPEHLRRVHPADLHVTIAYFGRIDPELHGPILAAIASVRFDGLTVCLGGVLALPSRQRPTAITLRLGPGPGNDAVAQLIRTHRNPLLELAGRPHETRVPLPHITFARPRGRKMDDAKRQSILAWCDGQSAVNTAVRLSELALIRSRPPGGPGPHYEVLRPGSRAS